MVGMNFDPSHLIWMGGDPVAAIRAPSTSTTSTARTPASSPRPASTAPSTPATSSPFPAAPGTLSPSATAYRGRGWLEIVGALRDVRYEDVISIENEDYTLETKAAIAESVDTLRFAIAEFARRRQPAA